MIIDLIWGIFDLYVLLVVNFRWGVTYQCGLLRKRGGSLVGSIDNEVLVFFLVYRSLKRAWFDRLRWVGG